MIGLKVLDEPAAQQSDPNVLELQIRVVSKQSARLEPIYTGLRLFTKLLTNIFDKKPVIRNFLMRNFRISWIRDISDLHRSKPNPIVHYIKPMPEIDTLMQVIYFF